MLIKIIEYQINHLALYNSFSNKEDPLSPEQLTGRKIIQNNYRELKDIYNEFFNRCLNAAMKLLAMIHSCVHQRYNVNLSQGMAIAYHN